MLKEHPLPLLNQQIALEDLNFLLTSYLTREDNIFHIKLLITQIIESSKTGNNENIPIDMKSVIFQFQNNEKCRQNYENEILKRLKNLKCQVQHQKIIIYKLTSKILKINATYFSKMQFYFPKLAELMTVEQGEF